MINNETLQKCYGTRAMGSQGPRQKPPMWETSYRDSYCTKVTELNTSEAITTHKLTGFR